MLRRLFAWVSRHERSVSAGAMVAGFVVDQIFFGRVDVWQTQAVFASYVGICFVSITLLHWIEERADRGIPRPRWRSVVPVVTQFALGGFWSGFVFFYGKSAAISASWPFLLLLAGILIGNELLKKYHDRLVFTSVLFFFALYSYFIFELPIFVGTISTLVFLESGVVAICVYALFTALLRIVGQQRFLKEVWRIRFGSLMVLVLINIFYFTNVLPPLPLSAEAVGIYHSIQHKGDVYTAQTDEHFSWFSAPWRAAFGFTPVVSVVPGESLYAYSAVFAPVALTTKIVHQWQHFDTASGQWITLAAISFPISGGRDGGYRGYSAKANPIGGAWRVNVETGDGRVIARIPFKVVEVSLPSQKETITLP